MKRGKGFFDSLDMMEKEAILFIQKNCDKEGFSLSFSGGKDSIVLYSLAKRAEIKLFPFYACTGIDPPEVVKFIKQNYSEVIFVKPKKSFFAMIPEKGKGFPTAHRRWCCAQLKSKPLTAYVKEHNITRRFLVGIRAEESTRRRGRGRIDKYAGNVLFKPIFYWQEWMIWDYIENYNLQYCSLYDEGFDRLGCCVCPFILGKRQERAKKKWPQIYKAFEKAMEKLWVSELMPREVKEKYGYDFSAFLNAWYLGESLFEARDNNQKKLF